MNHAMIAIIFTLVFAGNTFAQPEVKVETNSYSSNVKVSDDSFAQMCQSFQKKLPHDSFSGIIVFRPKNMPIGQDERTGSIWVLETSGNNIEFPQSELAPYLRKISGTVARGIIKASCYTENALFFGMRDVMIVTVRAEDALNLEQVLK